MKMVKKTGILLFAVIFLTESMGITVFHHICSGSNQHEVTLYPEFFRHAPSCGCSEEEQNSNPGDGTSMDSPSCCQNITLFCKLPVNTLPAEQNDIAFSIYDHGVIIAETFALTAPEITVETGIHFDSHAPPHCGTSLIHFLHQIKIPSPISLV